MQGYQIRVAAIEEKMAEGLIFVERNKHADQYAIPSAFDFYAKYMKEEKRT